MGTNIYVSLHLKHLCPTVLLLASRSTQARASTACCFLVQVSFQRTHKLNSCLRLDESMELPPLWVLQAPEVAASAVTPAPPNPTYPNAPRATHAITPNPAATTSLWQRPELHVACLPGGWAGPQQITWLLHVLSSTRPSQHAKDT